MHSDIKTLYPNFDKSTEIAFHHLMTHTAGFGYGGEWGSLAGWMHWLLDPLDTSDSLSEMMSKLDGIPLHNEPGTAFKYGISSDVQGAVIAKANGKRPDAYMQESIFTPLGMGSVVFVRKGQEMVDLVPFYRFDKETKTSVLVEDATKWDRPVLAGGSGLTGTAEDFMKFLRVLREPQRYADILPPAMVKTMMQNQLSADVQHIPEFIYPNSGFGYGMAVSLKDGEYLPKGSVYWAGMGGTVFWHDPVNDVSVVVMIQQLGGRKLIEKYLVPMIYEWLLVSKKTGKS